MIVGYRRVSTETQRFDRQELGEVDRLFDEKYSGKGRDRPQLEACLAFVREGDTLVVHSVDRLARSLKDLLGIVEELTSRGVVVKFLTNNLTFDPQASDPYQVAMLSMLGTFAQLERDIIAIRQREGIAIAVAKGGVFRGRQPALKPEQVKIARQRHRDGVTLTRLIRDYGCAKITMQHALAGRGVYGTPAYQ